MWHVTCDMWQMTYDKWDVICDMWHMEGGEHSLKMSVPSSYGFGVKVFLRFGGKGLLNSEWMNERGVWRPAPATPGLWILSWIWNACKTKVGKTTIWGNKD